MILVLLLDLFLGFVVGLLLDGRYRDESSLAVVVDESLPPILVDDAPGREALDLQLACGPHYGIALIHNQIDEFYAPLS